MSVILCAIYQVSFFLFYKFTLSYAVPLTHTAIWHQYKYHMRLNKYCHRYKFAIPLGVISDKDKMNYFNGLKELVDRVILNSYGWGSSHP